MKTGRPREFDKGEALEAAMQLFWRKGFESTSKRELLDAMGIASQSLYNAFGDKRELYFAAIRHYAQTRMGILIDMLEAPGSPLENLRGVVRLWGDPPEEFAKGCFMCNAIAEFGGEEEELADFLQDKLERMLGAYTQVLERAVAAGELSAEANLSAIAATLVCTSNGIALLYRNGAGRQIVGDVVTGLLLFLDAAAVQ